MNKIKLLIIIIITFFFQSNFGQSKDNVFCKGLKNSKVYKETLFPNFENIEIYKPKYIKSKIKNKVKIINKMSKEIEHKINTTYKKFFEEFNLYIYLIIQSIKLLIMKPALKIYLRFR